MDQPPIQPTVQAPAFSSPAVSMAPEKKPANKLFTIAASILSLLLFAIFLPRWIIRPSTVSVVGAGILSVEPKSASMIVMRLNVAQDANVAIDNGESGINTLINVVKSNVGVDADIQKAFYTVTPSLGQQTSTGDVALFRSYQVGNAFKVTFSDVTLANDLIKNLYANGATSITSIAFSPENKAEVEQQARDLAFQDAKEQATKMAKAVGKRLGRIISIADDQAAVEGTVSSAQGADGTSNIEISKQVSVVYEIW